MDRRSLLAGRGIVRQLCLPAALAAILAVTLWPLGGEAPRAFSTCLLCGETAGRDAFLNVLLFMPLGAALVIRGVTISRTIAGSFAVSLLVELLQFTLVRGREASVTDLLTNTVGACLGAIAATRLASWTSDRTDRRRWLVSGGAAIWMTVIGVTSWGLSPDAPSTRRYWGQHAHDLPGFVRFDAQVIESTINGRDLPDGPIEASTALRTDILGRGYQLNASVSSLPRTSGGAEVVALVDGENHFLALLELRDCEVYFSARARGQRLGLVPRPVRLDRACGQDAAELTGSSDARGMTITMDRNGAVRSSHRRTSPATGWSLLAPDGLPMNLEWLWTMLWLAAPVATISAWARTKGGRMGILRWIGLSAAACLVLVAAARACNLALPTAGDGVIICLAAAVTLIPQRSVEAPGTPV